jgi:hypothetical protein
MRPFMNVNPSIRCLLKVILSMLLQMEAGSALKTKGVAGLDWNMVGTFALLLGYVLRLHVVSVSFVCLFVYSLSVCNLKVMALVQKC